MEFINQLITGGAPSCGPSDTLLLPWKPTFQSDHSAVGFWMALLGIHQLIKAFFRHEQLSPNHDDSQSGWFHRHLPGGRGILELSPWYHQGITMVSLAEKNRRKSPSSSRAFQPHFREKITISLHKKSRHVTIFSRLVAYEISQLPHFYVVTILNHQNHQEMGDQIIGYPKNWMVNTKHVSSGKLTWRTGKWMKMDHLVRWFPFFQFAWWFFPVRLPSPDQRHPLDGSPDRLRCTEGQSPGLQLIGSSPVATKTAALDGSSLQQFHWKRIEKVQFITFYHYYSLVGNEVSISTWGVL